MGHHVPSLTKCLHNLGNPVPRELMLQTDKWELLRVLVPLAVLFLVQILLRWWRKGKAGSLLQAAMMGEAETVSGLLSRGALVDERDPISGRTPLIIAAVGGHIDIARILLARGADPSARDMHGWTALMYAQSLGFTEIEHMLRQAGAEE